jgi:hypothetical protein
LKNSGVTKTDPHNLELVLERWLDAAAVEQEWSYSPELPEFGLACNHDVIALVRFLNGTAGWVCSACGPSERGGANSMPATPQGPQPETTGTTGPPGRA